MAPLMLMLLILLTVQSDNFVWTATLQKTPQKLLVVLLDGFRWDYVSKVNLTNFQSLHALGAHAEYVVNDFPTLSYPNYYTLMTGLHTGNHGMTGNYMYDVSRNEYFLIGTNKEQFNSHWWDGGEPLWVTAVGQNKKTYMYFWPGCDVIRQFNPTFCDPYVRATTLNDLQYALQNATYQLTEGGQADLAIIYHEEPDNVGHKYGPDSDQLVDTLQNIDVELGNLLDDMNHIKDKYQINLIVISDHGMTSINSNRVINISQALDGTDLYITIMENGAIATIYTKDQNATDQVYNLLVNYSPHMKVYKKADIPDRYRYKHGKYVANITCVADLGWVIIQLVFGNFPQKDGRDMMGTHGYDNNEKDMRGIFYAYGPYFKPGAEVTNIWAVDPYNIMCDILHINPAPNNGSRQRLTPLLATSSGHCLTAYNVLIVGTNIVMLTLLIL